MSTTATKSAIKPEILELSEKLKAEITLDKKTGVATVSPDTYMKLAPAELTKDVLESVQQFNANMIAASAHAIGTLAVPAMKKDASLDKVTLTIPTVGKDYIGVAFDRSRQVPDRGADGVNGTKTKFGSTSTEFVIYGTKSRGQLLNVKNELSEMAMKAFGK